MWWPFKLPEPYDARIQKPSNISNQIPVNQPVINNDQIIKEDDAITYKNLYTSPRSLHQFSIFAAGATFLTLSILITRRALTRKLKSLQPSGHFTPSNQTPSLNGYPDAFEALSLATLNVTAFGVMLVGGGMWAFDVSNLDDLKGKVRKGMGIENEIINKEDEEDVEEWMASVLARLQGKGEGDIMKMVKELEEKNSNNKDDNNNNNNNKE